MKTVHDSFVSGPGPHWRRRLAGQARLDAVDGAQRFVLGGASAQVYANAQLDDYQGLPRRRFPWRPPLRLAVRARFSHDASALRGTAGFGFWNDPFLMTGFRPPALPRAIWFFHASPPADMKLDLAVPGHGWKAAAIDARRPTALLLAPLALPAILLMNLRPLYRRLWPPIQRAINVAEAALAADMRAWQTYRLDWGQRRAEFYVNEERVLVAPAPRGPLGLVVWMDNQFLVATPWGRLRWGLLPVPGEQWLEVDSLAVEPLESEPSGR